MFAIATVRQKSDKILLSIFDETSEQIQLTQLNEVKCKIPQNISLQYSLQKNYFKKIIIG